MRRARLAMLGLSVAIAIPGGWFLFPTVPLERQFALASFLATVGATLFAILGVWLAVLDPKTLAASQGNGPGAAQLDLARQLLQPWVYATSVFALAVLLAFVLGAAPPAWDGTPPIRQTTGGLLTLLLCLILDTLLGTLLPVAHLQRQDRVRQLREASRR